MIKTLVRAYTPGGENEDSPLNFFAEYTGGSILL